MGQCFDSSMSFPADLENVPLIYVHRVRCWVESLLQKYLVNVLFPLGNFFLRKKGKILCFSWNLEDASKILNSILPAFAILAGASRSVEKSDLHSLRKHFFFFFLLPHLVAEFGSEGNHAFLGSEERLQLPGATPFSSVVKAPPTSPAAVSSGSPQSTVPL